MTVRSSMDEIPGAGRPEILRLVCACGRNLADVTPGRDMVLPTNNPRGELTREQAAAAGPALHLTVGTRPNVEYDQVHKPQLMMSVWTHRLRCTRVQGRFRQRRDGRGTSGCGADWRFTSATLAETWVQLRPPTERRRVVTAVLGVHL